jgi:hypothetical protein
MWQGLHRMGALAGAMKALDAGGKLATVALGLRQVDCLLDLLPQLPSCQSDECTLLLICTGLIGTTNPDRPSRSAALCLAAQDMHLAVLPQLLP